MHTLEKGNKAIIIIGKSSKKERVEVIGKKGKYILFRPLEVGSGYGKQNGGLSAKVAEEYEVDEKHVGSQYGIYHATIPPDKEQNYDWVPPTSISR